MILHVYPDQRADRIEDGIMRARFRDSVHTPSLLEPGKVYKYGIELWFTSRVIPADNERHPKAVLARQHILHDSAHRSFVRLPLVPR